MPRRAAILVFVCVASLIGGCAEPSRPVSDRSVAFKSDAERRQYEKRALAGDTTASRRLMEFYFTIRHDPEKAYHWAEVGAAHGDKEAEEDMARLNDILEQKWRRDRR